MNAIGLPSISNVKGFVETSEKMSGWRKTDGKTVCRGLEGYMPSVGLRAAIGAFFLFCFFFVERFGLIAALITILIVKAPSQELVKRVQAILEKSARRA